MFVYVEYYSRRPGISLENFHALASAAQTGWSSEFEGEAVALNVGRTWRIGPDQEYLAVWTTPADGSEYLQEWENVFQSGDADRHQNQFETVARIDRAGCFTSNQPIEPPTSKRHLIEYFEPQPGVTTQKIDAYLETRSVSTGVALTAVLHRIGMLAPHGGLAIWAIAEYSDLSLMSFVAPDAPITIIDVGLYADLGEEQL